MRSQFDNEDYYRKKKTNNRHTHSMMWSTVYQLFKYILFVHYPKHYEKTPPNCINKPETSFILRTPQLKGLKVRLIAVNSARWNVTNLAPCALDYFAPLYAVALSYKNYYSSFGIRCYWGFDQTNEYFQKHCCNKVTIYSDTLPKLL